MTDIIEVEKHRTVIISDDSSSDVLTVERTSNITTEIRVSEIIELDQTVEILESTKQGLPGKDGDKHYTHIQSVASDTWTINHDLTKFPSVSIVDSAGTVVEGDIKMLDNQSVEVKFSASFSGKAYCN